MICANPAASRNTASSPAVATGTACCVSAKVQSGGQRLGQVERRSVDRRVDGQIMAPVLERRHRARTPWRMRPWAAGRCSGPRRLFEYPEVEPAQRIAWVGADCLAQRGYGGGVMMLAGQFHAQIVGGRECARIALQRAAVVVGCFGSVAGPVGDEPGRHQEGGIHRVEWSALATSDAAASVAPRPRSARARLLCRTSGRMPRPDSFARPAHGRVVVVDRSVQIAGRALVVGELLGGKVGDGREAVRWVGVVLRA